MKAANCFLASWLCTRSGDRVIARDRKKNRCRDGKPPTDSMGRKSAWIIFIAIAVLLVLAALVATGRVSQKGPHKPGGPLGPPL